MRLLAIILLLFFYISPVTAEIYKGMDSEGEVTYSDKETPNSKIIPTPSSNTIQMPKAQPKQPAEEVSDEAGYSAFMITAPGKDATIRSSQGNVSVTLSIEPALNLKQGHTISVLVDGQPFIKSTTLLSVELTNIDRGIHTVKARVRDKQGKSIISSNSVRFHMKRLSSQHSTPTGTPPGPSQPDGSSYTPGPQGTPYKPGPVIPPPAP